MREENGNCQILLEKGARNGTRNDDRKILVFVARMIRFLFTLIKKNQKKYYFGLENYQKGGYFTLATERSRMGNKKKPLPVIGLRANEDEQAMFNLIRKTYRIPSNSHVIRVLVTREYEKILAENTPIGVNIGE